MADSGAGSSVPTDDEIFRRKLMMDGEGMGHSKQLDTLLQSFLTWCDNKDASSEEIVTGCEKSMAILSSIELTIKKSAQAQEADKEQIAIYDQECAEIEKKIEDVQKTIIVKKEELEKAEKAKKQKLKYDAMARIIDELPDRKQTEERSEVLKSEISDLKQGNAALQKRIERQNKHAAVFLTAAQGLKNKLRREELEEWEDTDSD